MPRIHSSISRSREWYALSAVTESGRRRGVPTLPRTGGTASITLLSAADYAVAVQALFDGANGEDRLAAGTA